MMESRPEQRATRRFSYETAIMLEHYPSDMYFEGRMFNYSRDGMYLESNFAPDIGTEIFIGVENSPYTSGHDVYRARVIWRTRVRPPESLFLHGIGVRHF